MDSGKHKISVSTVKFLALLLFIFFVVEFKPVAAQNSKTDPEDPSLTQTLQNLSQDAARSYLNPISSAYGANLNAGWFHRAPKAKKFGFDLELGLVAMGSFFDQGSKSFASSGRFRFRKEEAAQLTENLNLTPEVQQALINEIISNDYTVSISGPTIIGSSTDSIQIAFSGQDIRFPNPNNPHQDTTVTINPNTVILPVTGFKDLADIKFLPLLAPQFSIGTLFGTQATFRYLPTTRINNDLGDFSYFGFGIQHNPGVWLPIPLPFDIAMMYATQRLKIGSLFETTTNAFGLNISKELGVTGLNVTPYAGFMLESSEMCVTYDLVLDSPTGPITQKIDFKMEGENKTRATIGLSIRLLLININADYNFGKYNSASMGLNLRF